MSAVTAKAPYDPKHPDALAMYCSDGRFTDAVEELLRSLGHPRLDTLTMPGGPALLDLGSASFSALEAVRSATSFLVRGHGIKRAVLVAHEGCGYYKDRHRFDTPEQVLQQQVTDLRTAAQWFAGAHPDVAVALYLAQPEKAKVRFHPIAVEPK
jgi:hypothetical protein